MVTQVVLQIFMGLDQDILKQLMPLFQAEAQDYLQALNRLLLELEKNPGTEATERLLTEIFRVAHTLKGSARTVRLDSVGKLAHALESLFGRMQRGQVVSAPYVFDQAYHALDRITDLVAKSAQGDLAPVDVSADCAALEALDSQAQTILGDDRAVQVIEPASIVTVEPAQPPALELPRALAPTSPESSPHIETHTEETVRVAVSKLDAIFTDVGELQVARIGSEQRLIETRALIDSLESWETRWTQTRSTYQRILALLDDANKIGAGSTQMIQIDPGDLVALSEFLAVNEEQLDHARASADGLYQDMMGDSRRMAQVTSEMQDDVRRMRMMPIAAVFDTFPRMVRDLARDLGKQVRLEFQGSQTEIDRSMLEQIKAPLLHLLRNSVDHGIELPTERVAAGKPSEGTITLSASQRGASVVIQISDDGAGIDPSQVKASAIKKGTLDAHQAQALSDREALWLIFRSGVSTRALVTDVSGRGVGMDVVRQAVEQMQGVIDLTSVVGQGTTFTLSLPLTVTATLSLLANVGGETFAVPLINVERIVRMTADEIGQARGHNVIQYNERPIVTVDLADLLQTSASANRAADAKRFAIVISSAEKRAAFLADALIGAQEIVVKSFPRPFVRVRHAAGASILGTGQVIVVLNAADLLRAASQETIQARAPIIDQVAVEDTGAILIADDSITVRMLEKNILESAGYRVRVAADGAEAWSLLQTEGIAPDGAIKLVISDVNMPRLDGFDLIAKIRADERFKTLPTILITSLASRQDRERGIEVGADAYIVKSAFDQDALLSTIRQLI